MMRLLMWYGVWTVGRAVWQSRELFQYGDVPSVVDALVFNVGHFAVRPFRLPVD